jgi:hypothetical protein
MQKVTRNTFEKGLNTDQELSKVQPVQYTDAQNVELVGDGDFFALKNIKGTTNVQNVISSANGSVIGVFENIYDINGQNKKCLTIFTLEDDYSVVAESTTYILTGSSANLTYAAAPGSKTMVASAGTFVLTGQASTNELAYPYLIKGLEDSGLDACSLISLSSGGSIVYSDVNDLSAFVTGDTVLYTDSFFLNPFTGAGIGSFYKIRAYASGTEYNTEVESDGTVYSLNSCV